MAWSDVPASLLVLVPLVWISAALYLYVVVYILRGRRKDSRFLKTPFFNIALAQAFWDLSMFLFSFFFIFCRMYLLLPYPEMINNFWSSLMYFLQTYLRNGMYFTSLLLAISRLTALHFKTPISQDRVWSIRNVTFFTLLIGFIAFANVGRLFINNPSVIIVHVTATRLKMTPDPELLEKDGWQDLVVSISCCSICSAVYIWAAFKSRRLGQTGANKYQLKFLKCAVTVFIPYIPNAIKSVLIIYANSMSNIELTRLCIDSWLYTTWLMCLIQPWALVVTYPRIRPFVNPNVSTVASSRNHTLRIKP